MLLTRLIYKGGLIMYGYLISFWDLSTGKKIEEKEIVFASQQGFFDKLQRAIESIQRSVYSIEYPGLDIVYRIEAVL